MHRDGASDTPDLATAVRPTPQARMRRRDVRLDGSGHGLTDSWRSVSARSPGRKLLNPCESSRWIPRQQQEG